MTKMKDLKVVGWLRLFLTNKIIIRMSEIKYRQGTLKNLLMTEATSSRQTDFFKKSMKKIEPSSLQQRRTSEREEYTNSFNDLSNPDLAESKTKIFGLPKQATDGVEKGFKIERANSYNNKSSDSFKRSSLFTRDEKTRKNSPPNQINRIYELLHEKTDKYGLSPRKVSGKLQLNQDKHRILIEKMIDIRCKVIKVPKKNPLTSNNQSSHKESSTKNQQKQGKIPEEMAVLPIVKPERTKLTNICDFLMVNLQNEITENEQNQQFNELLMRKNSIDRKQYSNRELYNEIRKQYKDIEPVQEGRYQSTAIGQTSQKFNSNKKNKQQGNIPSPLKTRGQIKSQFTFKIKKTSPIKKQKVKDEEVVAGWFINPE